MPYIPSSIKRRDDLVGHFEGFHNDAYLDSEGIPTIGVGATTYEDDSPVRMGDSISNDRVQELLEFHMGRAREKVSQLEGYGTLPPNTKAAVDSFAFNVGPNFIDRGDDFATITSAIKDSDPEAIAKALPLYDNGGTPGLVRRRATEARLAVQPAMDPVDSTLANDRSRKFGTDAIREGNPVKWGGIDHGWQSPESFSTIEPPRVEPEPIANDFNPLNTLFGIFQ